MEYLCNTIFVTEIKEIVKKGKHECDDDMLKELDVLEPKNLREKIDRKLVKAIIGTKRKLGLGIEWSDDLTEVIKDLTVRSVVKLMLINHRYHTIRKRVKH